MSVVRRRAPLVLAFKPNVGARAGVSVKAKKRESIRRINNPKATGSEPLQKLEPRLSRYDAPDQDSASSHFGNVRTRFVDHDVNIVSFRAQLPVAALNSLAVVLFRLDN